VAAVGLAVCAFLYWRLQEGWNFSRFHLGLCRVVFSFFAGVLLCRTRPAWAKLLPAVPVWAVLSLAALALLLPIPAPIRPLYDLGFILVGSPLLIMLGSNVEPKRGLGPAILAGTLSYPVYAFHQPLRDLVRDLSASPGINPHLVAAVTMLCLFPLSYALATYYDEPLESGYRGCSCRRLALRAGSARSRRRGPERLLIGP
jgi:peptidoglycan/LPS O-acetylase OafA/YrhL